MGFVASLIHGFERLPFPDAVVKAGISVLCARTMRKLAMQGDADRQRFIESLDRQPIAVHTDAANEQHYELPSAFFALCLGAQRKYSCCFYENSTSTLNEAEEAALRLTLEHAALSDGQDILELGCGWGSLTLFMAKHLPNARITAVSNSHSQRAFIEAEAKARRLSNVTVITADMNAFKPAQRFDRVVSVEMFEHMSNWRSLLRRIHGWLNEDGRLFLHVFTHISQGYRFDHTDTSDWIARYFFTGGIMPPHDLPHAYPDLFAVEAEWRWSGQHYARTARHWLANMDAKDAEVSRLMQATYGKDWALWKQRWRWFYLATEGLFGHAGGEVWGVGHYRLKKTPAT